MALATPEEEREELEKMVLRGGGLGRGRRGGRAGPTLRMCFLLCCSLLCFVLFWRTWEKGDSEAPLGRPVVYEGVPVKDGTWGKCRVTGNAAELLSGPSGPYIQRDTNKRLHTLDVRCFEQVWVGIYIIVE